MNNETINAIALIEGLNDIKDTQEKAQTILHLSKLEKEVLYHIHNTTSMPTKKEYKEHLLSQEKKTLYNVTLSQFFKYARNPKNSRSKLFDAATSLLYRCDDYAGQDYCKKLAKILFRESRIGFTLYEFRKIIPKEQ